MLRASKVGISSKIYQEFVGMKQFTEYIENLLLSPQTMQNFLCAINIQFVVWNRMEL